MSTSSSDCYAELITIICLYSSVRTVNRICLTRDVDPVSFTILLALPLIVQCSGSDRSVSTHDERSVNGEGCSLTLVHSHVSGLCVDQDVTRYDHDWVTVSVSTFTRVGVETAVNITTLRCYEVIRDSCLDFNHRCFITNTRVLNHDGRDTHQSTDATVETSGGNHVNVRA